MRKFHACFLLRRQETTRKLALSATIMTIMNNLAAKRLWFISCMQKMWTCIVDNGSNWSFFIAHLSRERRPRFALPFSCFIQTTVEKENTHVEHIQKIKICTDDDTLNLASADVTIHEYLIMKTFVLIQNFSGSLRLFGAVY